MARFTGTFEELKGKLAPIDGTWKELNPGQKQLKTPSGGILNWYPSTGTFTFQGKSPAMESLRVQVEQALGLQSPASIPSSSESGPSHEAAQSRFAASGQTSQGSSTPSVADAQQDGARSYSEILSTRFADSELVFGLIGAVGTELVKVRLALEDRLKAFGYRVNHVRVTQDVIPLIVPVGDLKDVSEHNRITALMDAGNKARQATNDNSVLALGAAAFINQGRVRSSTDEFQHKPRCAYIVSSLKHPDEVSRLREIYPEGFFLIAVHASEKRRFDYLTKDKSIPDEKADALIRRDENENWPYGQKVNDAFHLADFFVRIDGHDDCLKQSLWRILDILFGHPYKTPTFDEYAMFMAFAASLRSADLSRQVGAVVAVDDQVVSTGANDCPKAGGGLYWPQHNRAKCETEDYEDGRDYMRGEDSNRIEQQKIIDEILDGAVFRGLDRSELKKVLLASRIRDLTEFGRVVHAEMEALLACGRARISVKNGTVYTTTFPCHNCAKHIVAAGIKRVVYIEPYQKSKAEVFHTDSIRVGFPEDDIAEDERDIVWFQPFVGVGPRRFFDLFSMRLGSGSPLIRKDSHGHTIEWEQKDANLRLQMMPVSYLGLEYVASDMFLSARKLVKESCHGD